MDKAQAKEIILQLANIIVETAKEAGPMGAPSGPVYAAFMERGMNIHQYNALVDALVKAGKIKIRHSCLIAV